MSQGFVVIEKYGEEDIEERGHQDMGQIPVAQHRVH
jgi:hypothetical protein